MFNVSRRGTASLLRFAQQSSAFAPVLRTPTFSLAQATAARPAILARYLHISSPARSIDASARFSDEAYEPEELQVGVPLPEGEIITKFQHLADKGHVHHAIITEITQGMGHHTMTEVQSLTIDESLRGTDMCV
jgi:ATP-dependent RNA helicase MSS116